MKFVQNGLEWETMEHNNMFKYSHSTQGILSSWKNRSVLITMSMTYDGAFREAERVKGFQSFTIFEKRLRHWCLRVSKYTPEEIYLIETPK